MRRTWIAVVSVLLALGTAVAWILRDHRSKPELQVQPAPTLQVPNTAPSEVHSATRPAIDVAMDDPAQSDGSIVRSFESNMKAEAEEWVDGLFITNSRGMQYDRVRLVDINWFALLRSIKTSPLYLQSCSGSSVSTESVVFSNSFYLEPFDDKKYQMIMERVDVHETGGVSGIALMGLAQDSQGKQGTWQMSIVENERSLSGHINAPDVYTTFGPGPDSAFHVFREVSQESRRRQMEGATY